MIFLYYGACLINSLLITAYTEFRPSDALWWLWTALPIVAFTTGRMMNGK